MQPIILSVTLIRIALTVLILLPFNTLAHPDAFPSLVAKIKRSVTGVGLFDPKGAPRNQLLGSGFIFLDGSYIATNYHVISNIKQQDKQQYAIFLKHNDIERIELADLVAKDTVHDLAILKFQKPIKLPPVTISNPGYKPDGLSIAFTGYPIGSVLGLYPVTHRGYISALTPVAIPANFSHALTAQQIKRLRDPFLTYQLNATAYPGNSGSAVYDINTGEVIAVINKVYVKSTKEAVLSDPSDISYAIPIKHLIDLAKKIKR